MNQPDIWQLLNNLPQPEQPFITLINELGRVELSGRTLVNGICKAANAFRDILDAEPGQSVHIDLGWTWQQGVWQGAALTAGLTLVDTEGADFLISPNVISTHPMGMPSGGPEDITAEVLGQPDIWHYPEYFPEQYKVIEQARNWAHKHGISNGDRVGVDTSVLRSTGEDHLPLTYLPLLVPLIKQGSVVIFDQVSEDIDRLSEQEKVTLLLTP